MTAEARRRLTWFSSAAWFIGATICLAAWWHFRDPQAVTAAPSWLTSGLALMGNVWYDEVGLVLRVRITRLLMVLTAAWLIAMGLLHRQRVVRVLREAFDTVSHPLNLAVFRIVVFWQIYKVGWFNLISRVAGLPDDLQYPPFTGIPGVGPLRRFENWPLHPLGPEQILFWGTVMKVACVTAIVGLFTRASALVVAILFFFVWGSMQWYGKVDHHHHLLWFALLLAASRSGDALSLDSLRAAWRRADRGSTEPPGPSVAYGRPLAFAMVLIGVIYFFPGAWKLRTSGLDWALGENLLYTMHTKWRMVGGWLPDFRLDHYPVLYRLGGVSTLVFELSAIFLILNRQTRLIAAAMGFSFHWLTNAVMRIGFESLRNCYVVFIDWYRGLSWIGGRLFRHSLVVVYDGQCSFCRRSVALIRLFDWLGRIEWLDVHDERTRAREKLRSVSDEALLREIHAVCGDRVWVGYDAYRAIASRVPLFWVAWPLLYLFPIPTIGRWTYQALARARTCSPVTPLSVRQAFRRSTARSVVLVTLIGGALVLGNVWAGAARIHDGWPLASYPLFDGITPPSYETLRVHLLQASGEEREIDPDQYRNVLGDRWNHLIRRILRERDEETKLRRLHAAWNALLEHDPELADGQALRFYTVRIRVAPEHWNDPPEDPRLLEEVPLGEDGRIAP